LHILALNWKRVLAISLTLSALLAGAAAAHAHPVPKRAHDRTIEVRVLPGAKDQRLVQVRYRLEVDEFTVVFDDLPALGDKLELKKFREPREFYDAYVTNYGPILADNLRAKIDGQPVNFTVRSATHTLRDERDTPLGHLRCDFVFEGPYTFSPGAQHHRLTFREGNYEFEEGRILLSLAKGPDLIFESVAEPDQALKEKPRVELKPGEEAKLRLIEATFTFGTPSTTISAAIAPPAANAADAQVQALSSEGENSSLLELLLDNRRGLLLLLLLAAGFGAAHALTPGHGKTLVAAYLVGERGTAWHALFLGLVTTITHTGAVILLAVLLVFLFPKAVPAELQMLLGFVGGLMITGMGFWLLLRRLGGGADHFHVGGGHHHHHHHAPPTPDQSKVGWFGLVVLGISGGIVPCWDAILMLGFAISAQRLWLALPLLLAFSAGLAAVLIVIGLGVVYLKGFADSRMGESRVIKLLPLASAALVTLMGLGLCYESIHAKGPATAPTVERKANGV
jgi:ABC-type nickel/cobalt efflux system permease component RcnA